MIIEVEGGGHRVRIDAEHTDVSYMRQQVMALWEATKQPERGGATGFALVERRGGEDLSATDNGGGGYRRRPHAPVTA